MQHPRPEDLKNPAVVIAFSGWNDAANAASDALLHLMEHYPSSELETIDDERYFDFQVTRPILRRSPDAMDPVAPHHPSAGTPTGTRPDHRGRSRTQPVVAQLFP